MLKHLRLTAAILVAALVLSMPATADASTYSNSYSGSDALSPTTLNYSSHPAFSLRVRVTKPALMCCPSTKYAIRMYDRYGRQVWSASNQGDRTYYIGSNIRKITISRNDPLLTVTRWERR